MSHLGQEALRRILGGEAGGREDEQAAEHLVSCERCRARAGTVLEELRAQGSPRREGPLQAVLDLIQQERRWGVEPLAAIAERAALRRLPSRRSQRERVRMNKACHTLAFFRLVLGELKEEPSWDEAEFLAGLALLALEGMSQRRLIAPASHLDLQGEVWTEVANARRRAAEWPRAHQALANAERYLKGGTGDRLLKARLLSITASTLGDEGELSEALDALERCRAIYEDLAEWELLARTLVKAASVLYLTEPLRGLAALDRAAPLIPAEDTHLRLLAEMLRVECLLEVERPAEALQVFRRCSMRLADYPSDWIRLRGRWTGARLLDALGFEPQAEKIYEEVLDREIEGEHYKAAFLDLLYLYGRHLKAGDLEKAARVCHRALTDSSLAAVAHEQMRTLWTELLEAAQRQAVSLDLLADLKRYLGLHWKHPAAKPPVVPVR